MAVPFPGFELTYLLRFGGKKIKGMLMILNFLNIKIAKTFIYWQK
jgi:hypothetical protein